MATKYLDDNGLLYLWGKLKAAFLSAISYDTTNKKLTVTKNGSTTDLVTAAKIVEDGGAVTDISGKADKDTDAVEGNFAAFDAYGNPVDSGHKHSDYITDISGKADIVSSGTENNFVALDSSGNIKDSGKSASDFVASNTVGAASGICPLDGSSKVDPQYLPSYVDDVVEIIAYESTAPSTCAKGDQYYNSNSKKIFTATAANTWSSTGEDPEKGKIYVLTVDGTTYASGTEWRWGGSDMVKLNDGGVSAITNAEIDVIVAS